MSGELLTIWTIRMALLCYAAYLAGWLVESQSQWWATVSRGLWTIGCLLFVTHVACAFHFYHGWSHQAAWETTAQQTEELIGWRYGDGIYFSYLFLFVWVFDVVSSWGHKPVSQAPVATAPAQASGWRFRPLWQACVHAYLFFIAFNGAIVFEDGTIRWAGIAACLLLGVLAVRYWMLQARASRNRQLQSDTRALKTVHDAP